jgi:hypothetical protein
MTGLFDRLNAQLGSEEPAGITPLDITDLPQDQKQLMLTLLRDQGGAVDGVTREALHSKFSDKLGDLDATLAQLARNGWLIVMGEAPNLRYRVNLKAKRGSTGGFGLWSVISDRVPQDLPGSGKKRD